MVTGPTPIQFLFPPAPRPSGVKTSSCSTPAPTSIGHASRLRVATDIRLITQQHRDADDRELGLLEELGVRRLVVRERVDARARQHHDEAEDDEDRRRAGEQVVAGDGAVPVPERAREVAPSTGPARSVRRAGCVVPGRAAPRAEVRRAVPGRLRHEVPRLTGRRARVRPPRRRPRARRRSGTGPSRRARVRAARCHPGGRAGGPGRRRESSPSQCRRDPRRRREPRARVGPGPRRAARRPRRRATTARSRSRRARTRSSKVAPFASPPATQTTPPGGKAAERRGRRVGVGGLGVVDVR